MSDSTNIDHIAREIMADMPLRENAATANLDEENLPYRQHTFDVCIGMDDELGKHDHHGQLVVAII